MPNVCLIVYDNHGALTQAPSNIAYLAAALQEAGHRVNVLDMATEHYTPEQITEHLDACRYDVVGFGSCGGYHQFNQLRVVSEAVNRSANRSRFAYVLGGHMASPDPFWFRERFEADAVFVGESEDTLAAYCDGTIADPVVYQKPRADVDSYPLPAWDLFNVSAYRLYPYPNKKPTQFAMPVLSGRGCTHACKFCYRVTGGWRRRDPKAIVEEIYGLRQAWGVSYANFSDELLAGSRARITEVCEEFLRAPFRFNWMCNMRVQFCKPDLLALMKRAGCVLVNLGCESLTDEVLEDIGKKQTAEQVRTAVKNCRDAELSAGLNVMWPASKHDNQASLDAITDFLLWADDGAQCRTVRPCTSYPGTEMFNAAVEAGKVRDVQDFYERVHTNSDLIAINPTDIPTEECHQMLYRANMRLLENYRDRWARSHEEQLRRLYVDLDPSFRGYRHG